MYWSKNNWRLPALSRSVPMSLSRASKGARASKYSRPSMSPGCKSRRRRLAIFASLRSRQSPGTHEGIAQISCQCRAQILCRTLLAVPSRGIFLEFVQSSLVEGSGVPLGIGEEPVEAGLVRGLGEFPVDTEHRLTLGHHQSSEVLSEVSPLAFVGEETTVLGQGVLHDLGKPDDSWHEQMLRSPFAPGEKWSKPAPSSPFLHKLP